GTRPLVDRAISRPRSPGSRPGTLLHAPAAPASNRFPRLVILEQELRGPPSDRRPGAHLRARPGRPRSRRPGARRPGTPPARPGGEPTVPVPAPPITRGTPSTRPVPPRRRTRRPVSLLPDLAPPA